MLSHMHMLIPHPAAHTCFATFPALSLSLSCVLLDRCVCFWLPDARGTGCRGGGERDRHRLCCVAFVWTGQPCVDAFSCCVASRVVCWRVLCAHVLCALLCVLQTIVPPIRIKCTSHWQTPQPSRYYSTNRSHTQHSATAHAQSTTQHKAARRSRVCGVVRMFTSAACCALRVCVPLPLCTCVALLLMLLLLLLLLCCVCFVCVAISWW